ncbi:hypothetical protein [Jiangella mangrovi]|uniref:Enoyl reductase n=1 Tax=Jiangella mangrovi TaxID=1524084 RepID=A0A7W9GR55_9ACTN|nr:hypothetical protein [Jiangella mangrovi]MBB5788256.1 hypothetical protein [Jiangella mangrovi]
MKAVVKGLLVAAAGAVLVLAVPDAAAARGGSGGDETGSGYEVGVEVTFTGDGAPGGGGTVTVSIPPVCWWESVSPTMMDGSPVDSGDPAAVWEWFQEIRPFLSGHATAGRYEFPSEDVFLWAIAQEEAGNDMTWYAISTDSPDVKVCSPNITQVPEEHGGEVAQRYAPFAAGDPPAPAVDPETLAVEARDLMEIDEPVVDRNPKLTGLGDATFVNLHTWFWVVDPETVGGDTGTRTIRADVEGSDVWAEVTATTDGLSIASPNGARQCDPERAQVAWASGASDADGCTVQFTRASVAYPEGYPVTATTAWTATWEGQEEDGTAVGGDLDPLQREWPVNVPVAEVQTVVKGGN